MKVFCIMCAIFITNAPAIAATIFSGVDPGAGPTSPRPNSDSAAAAFNVAAAGLGHVSLISFEDQPTGQFSSRTVFPGVTVSQSNYDPTLGGIVVNGYATPAGAPTGYNITSGGTKFIGFVPETNPGTARLDFVFATPVRAWGAYVVGLEPAVAGSVAVQFTDGTALSYPLAETTPAGPQFFGFTVGSGGVSQVTLLETGITGTRDIYGLDNVQFVAVPEPSAIVVAFMGVGTLFALRRRPTSHNRV